MILKLINGNYAIVLRESCSFQGMQTFIIFNFVADGWACPWGVWEIPKAMCHQDKRGRWFQKFQNFSDIHGTGFTDPNGVNINRSGATK